jgi:hypothetical protein
MVNRRAGSDSVRQPPSTSHAPDLDSSGDGKSAPKGKHGGKRPGAGRPPGSKDVLPHGAVAAIKAAGLRVPKDATPAERELADRALVRIADVMEERVSSFGAFSVLTAARGLREEICGKVADKHEHGGSIEVTRIERVIVEPAK